MVQSIPISRIDTDNSETLKFGSSMSTPLKLGTSLAIFRKNSIFSSGFLLRNFSDSSKVVRKKGNRLGNARIFDSGSIFVCYLFLYLHLSIKTIEELPILLVVAYALKVRCFVNLFSRLNCQLLAETGLWLDFKCVHQS